MIAGLRKYGLFVMLAVAVGCSGSSSGDSAAAVAHTCLDLDEQWRVVFWPEGSDFVVKAVKTGGFQAQQYDEDAGEWIDWDADEYFIAGRSESVEGTALWMAAELNKPSKTFPVNRVARAVSEWQRSFTTRISWDGPDRQAAEACLSG